MEPMPNRFLQKPQKIRLVAMSLVTYYSHRDGVDSGFCVLPLMGAKSSFFSSEIRLKYFISQRIASIFFIFSIIDICFRKIFFIRGTPLTFIFSLILQYSTSVQLLLQQLGNNDLLLIYIRRGLRVGIEPGPAIQKADRLVIELRRTLLFTQKGRQSAWFGEKV
jgi:hypothetical protein